MPRLRLTYRSEAWHGTSFTCQVGEGKVEKRNYKGQVKAALLRAVTARHPFCSDMASVLDLSAALAQWTGEMAVYGSMGSGYADLDCLLWIPLHGKSRSRPRRVGRAWNSMVVPAWPGN